MGKPTRGNSLLDPQLPRDWKTSRGSVRASSRPAGRVAARGRPCLEQLEDRLQPSVVFTLPGGPDAAKNGQALVAVVNQANLSADPDVSIQLGAGVYQLPSGTGELGGLQINRPMNIVGAGAEATTIQAVGSNNGGVFFLSLDSELGTTMSIAGLTITGGNLGGEGAGGGIYNGDADLTLEGVILTNNQAGFGGAIYNESDASLLMVNSTIEFNSAEVGGGILNIGQLQVVNSTIDFNSAGDGGGLYNNGQARLVNVTIGQNSASTGEGLGGGIYTVGPQLDLINVTLNANTAATAGGALYSPNDDVGTVQLINTIIAGSSGPGGGPMGNIAAPFPGTIVSLGHNLNSDASFFLSGPNDQNGVDPMLGPLQDNGGGTLTYALPAGSPAIAAAADPGIDPNSGLALPAADQRGVSRPIGADDIGAFQYVAPPPLPPPPAPPPVTPPPPPAVVSTTTTQPNAVATSALTATSPVQQNQALSSALVSGTASAGPSAGPATTILVPPHTALGDSTDLGDVNAALGVASILADATGSTAGDSGATTRSPGLSAGDLPTRLTKLMGTEGGDLGFLIDAGENIPVIEAILRGKGTEPVKTALPAQFQAPGGTDKGQPAAPAVTPDSTGTSTGEEASEPPAPVPMHSLLRPRNWLGGLLALGLAVAAWFRPRQRASGPLRP